MGKRKVTILERVPIDYTYFYKNIMAQLVEDIKSFTAPQKAEMFYLLQEDEELKNYLFADNRLFEELACRDADYAAGKLRLTTRQELTTRLQYRRNGL